jgi:hypothetical protein
MARDARQRRQLDKREGLDLELQPQTDSSRKENPQHDTIEVEAPSPTLSDRPEFSGAQSRQPPLGVQRESLMPSAIWEREGKGSLSRRTDGVLSGRGILTAGSTDLTPRRVLAQPGWHQATRSLPSLAPPERGGRSEVRGEPGLGEAQGNRKRSS